MSFTKKALNLLLILASVLATYLIVELFLFKPLLPYVPVHLYNHMVREGRILGQNSKKGLLPEKGYLSIAGDSYAQGKGDWFIESGYNRYAGFHSAHILHDKLGVDVITFGRSASGSVEGLVIEPIQDYRFLNRLGFDFPEPECMLAYFYEGNDIEDNLRFLSRHYDDEYPGGDFNDDADFEKYLDYVAATYASGVPRKAEEKPFFGNFLFRLFRDKVLNPITSSVEESDPLPRPGRVNRALVDGQVLAIPDNIQSPSVYFKRDRLEAAIKVFERSLRYSAKFFRNTKFFVVYIPSPLACYDLASDKVSTYYGEDALFDSRKVAEVGDFIHSEVRRIAEENDMPFIDAREYVREAARGGLVHGPRDWNHFNKRGYEALSEAIMDTLKDYPACCGEK